MGTQQKTSSINESALTLEATVSKCRFQEAAKQQRAEITSYPYRKHLCPRCLQSLRPTASIESAPALGADPPTIREVDILSHICHVLRSTSGRHNRHNRLNQPHHCSSHVMIKLHVTALPNHSKRNSQLTMHQMHYPGNPYLTLSLIRCQSKTLLFRWSCFAV